MKKRYLLLLVSFVLLGLLIYYSNPQEVFNALVSADPLWIGIGLSFWFLGALVRTFRWKYLLKNTGIKVGFLSTFKMYVAGMFISNLTPMKSGDPARAALVKKTEGESFSKGFSSIFVERVLDMAIVIPISVIGLLLLTVSLKISIWWVYLSIGIYTFIFSFGAFVLLSKDRTEKVTGKAVSVLSFIERIKKLEDRVEEFSQKISTSLKKYGDKKVVSLGLFLSLIIWTLNGVVAYSAFRAVGITVPFQVILAVMTTALLLSVLTFLPASLGSGDIIAVTLYSGFLGADISLLTTGKVLTRVLNFWMYAVIGGLFLLIFFKKELEV